jgi:hypothetical protein
MSLFVRVTSTAATTTAGVDPTRNTASIGAEGFSSAGRRRGTEHTGSLAQTTGGNTGSRGLATGGNTGGRGRRTGGNTGDSSHASDSVGTSSWNLPSWAGHSHSRAHLKRIVSKRMTELQRQFTATSANATLGGSKP